MGNNLMYDWSSLDCIDLSESKWQKNKLHEKYTFNGKVAAVNAGYPEPRCGIYFNKRLLTDAGIDPESLYDLQASGDWTWSAWTDMMAKVQRDINNDGQIDVYGFDANYGMPVSSAVYSNGSEYVGMENGKYVYKFEDPATVEALNWMVECFKNYVLVRPADAQWDYYKQGFQNGECAFMPEDAYCGNEGGWLKEMTDAQNGDVGFVMFPKGPQADDYTNLWSNNPAAIPGCYDADRAWKIAFAYNLFTDDVPGYENYVDFSQYRNGIFDFRAIDETLTMMISKGMITYHGLIPSLDMGEPFLWKFNGGTDVTAVLESIRVPFNEYIDAANN
jgi:putative hemolysin